MLGIRAIGTWGSVLGLLAVGGALGCTSDRGAALPSARREQHLDTGWRFLQGDAAGAEAPELDDRAGEWATVSVPHTWNAQDGQDGEGDYYRGPGWYRLHLPAPSPREGERVYLQFGAANAIADVYLNGVPLGQHRGGFSAFRFDATPALRGGDNVLAVRVDNSAAPDVPPLRADFTFFGGLYRDVHLLRVNAVHVDLSDDGSSGVYLSTSGVSADGAELSARVRVRNDGEVPEDVTVTLSVLDADGAAVAALDQLLSVPAGDVLVAPLSQHLTRPRLWQGRKDPYLYTAQVELRVAGKLVDRVEQPLGVRSLRLDPETGFWLNGEALDLHGVNRHQDRLDRGWAIGKAEHDEDLALILELGATGVRLAHYQQADYVYELCDRAGLVVWAEIPLVDEITDSEAFRENALQQLRELIRQSYNHPSIAFWGIGNEQRTDDGPTNALLGELAALVESEDPERISTYAHCCGSVTSNLVSHAEATGYNAYYGWYMGAAAQFGLYADALHAARPASAVAISEYGAGAALSHHEEPAKQPVATGGMFHPEEYQALLHEVTWPQMATRPFLWGKFIWNMFDFAVDSRNEGDTPGRNDKGLISYDRQVKKDAFFFYKASWVASPAFVHIAGRRFQPRDTQTIDVKVYSNHALVQLRVNGVPQAAPSNAESHIFRWNGVALAPGDNQVEATALGDGDTALATDSVVWTRR